VSIFLSRPLFTPAGLRTADALGLFRDAGFSAEQAVLLYQQVARYLLALVMLGTGSGHELTAEERRERARVARITFETLPADQYPNLIEAAPELASPYDPTEPSIPDSISSSPGSTEPRGLWAVTRV